jgi:hypothetical protein
VFRIKNPVPTHVNGAFRAKNPFPTRVNGAFQTKNPVPTRVDGVFQTKNPVPTRVDGAFQTKNPVWWFYLLLFTPVLIRGFAFPVLLIESFTAPLEADR